MADTLTPPPPPGFDLVDDSVPPPPPGFELQGEQPTLRVPGGIAPPPPRPPLPAGLNPNARPALTLPGSYGAMPGNRDPNWKPPPPPRVYGRGEPDPATTQTYPGGGRPELLPENQPKGNPRADMWDRAVDFIDETVSGILGSGRHAGGASMDEPMLPVSRLLPDAQKDENPLLSAVRGAARGVEGITSRGAGLTILGTGALGALGRVGTALQTVATAGFGASAGYGVATNTVAGAQKYQAGDVNGAAESWGLGSADLLFAALMARATARELPGTAADVKTAWDAWKGSNDTGPTGGPDSSLTKGPPSSTAPEAAPTTDTGVADAGGAPDVKRTGPPEIAAERQDHPIVDARTGQVTIVQTEAGGLPPETTSILDQIIDEHDSLLHQVVAEHGTAHQAGTLANDAPMAMDEATARVLNGGELPEWWRGQAETAPAPAKSLLDQIADEGRSPESPAEIAPVALPAPPPGFELVEPPPAAMAEEVPGQRSDPPAPGRVEEEERQTEPEPTHAHTVADTETATTAAGTKTEYQWRVVDASDLVRSHVGGAPNPEFPQNLQPRARDRAASEVQIQDLMAQLDPAKLGRDPGADRGAPMAVKRGGKLVVISGNGRTEALDRLYESGHANAEAYRQAKYEEAQAGEYPGVNPDDLLNLPKPVLVRQLVNMPQGESGGRWLERFAQESNEDDKAQMGASETAKADASRLTPKLMEAFNPTVEGEILHGGNMGFLRSFFDEVVPPGQRGPLMDKAGEISQAGVTRVRNAIFAYAYGADTQALEKLAESADSNIRNVTNGMVQAAPVFARMRDGIKRGELYKDVDLAGDVAEAAAKLSALRESGQTIPDYLKQIGLFGEDLSQEAKALLAEFHRNRGSAKRIAALLQNYARVVEAAGNPNQAGLFGTAAPPTKQEMLDAAIQLTERQIDEGQGKGQASEPSLFEDEPPASAGPDAGDAKGEKPESKPAPRADGGEESGGSPRPAASPHPVRPGGDAGGQPAAHPEQPGAPAPEVKPPASSGNRSVGAHVIVETSDGKERPAVVTMTNLMRFPKSARDGIRVRYDDDGTEQTVAEWRVKAAGAAPAVAPEVKPEAIPPRVLNRVKLALAQLQKIADALKHARVADEKFHGEGRYEWETWSNVSNRDKTIADAEGILATFRKHAAEKGIDAEASIAELGGVPDYRPTQKSREWGGEKKPAKAVAKPEPKPFRVLAGGPFELPGLGKFGVTTDGVLRWWRNGIVEPAARREDDGRWTTAPGVLGVAQSVLDPHQAAIEAFYQRTLAQVEPPAAPEPEEPVKPTSASLSAALAAAQHALATFRGAPVTQDSATAFLHALTDLEQVRRGLRFDEHVQLQDQIGTLSHEMYTELMDRNDPSLNFVQLMESARTANEGRHVFSMHEDALKQLHKVLGGAVVAPNMGFSIIKPLQIRKWTKDLQKQKKPAADRAIELIAQGAVIHGKLWDDLYAAEVGGWREDAHKPPKHLLKKKDEKPAAPEASPFPVAPDISPELVRAYMDLVDDRVDLTFAEIMRRALGAGSAKRYKAITDEQIYQATRENFEAGRIPPEELERARAKMAEPKGKPLWQVFQEEDEGGLTKQDLAFLAVVEKYLDLRGTAPRQDANKSLNNIELAKLANQAYGGTRHSGAWDIKQVYDLVEAAVAKWEKSYLHWNVNDPAGVLRVARAFMERLPRQTDRTPGQEAFQQFSTPPTIAFLANVAAGIQDDDVVLEPSAGTGMLASWAHAGGAQVLTNEIDPRRRAILRYLGFDPTELDAEQLHNLSDAKPTVVVMNPPFSAAGNRGITKDQEVWKRHVDQALLTLADGGRLVAILPGGRTGAWQEGASMDGPAAEWWDATMAKYNVRANILLDGKEYGKYGTTYPTRLVVIDKTGPTEGGRPLQRRANVVQTQGSSVEEALDAIRPIAADRPDLRPAQGDIRPSGEPAGEPSTPGSGSAPNPRPGGSVGRPGKRGPRGVSVGVPELEPESSPEPAGEPRPLPGGGGSPAGGKSRTPVVHHAPPVELGANLEAQAQQEVGSGTYVRYQPAKLRGGKEHPAPIVQPGALAAVDPPDITYLPKFDGRIVDEGKISNVQLEAVCYAGQRHERILPSGERAGIFIGDGTGVGKGREIAAIIADNWAQGRRRAIWTSISSDLIEDAKRDLNDLGLGNIPIRIVNEWKATDAIDMPEGIVFTTYASLIGESKDANDDDGKPTDNGAVVKRVDQLAKWAGAEGVIVFDEAHKAKNAWDSGNGEPTLTGKTVLEIQEKLPTARVVYASATGATEVKNMAYMTRLGLWGKGTSFGEFGDFALEIENGGVGAMEMVARDLKARGAYMARTISYEGVDYRERVHDLSAEQRKMYDVASHAWLEVITRIEEAIAKTKTPGRARGRALSQFWSAHQRFFKQLITAIKVPTCIEEIEKALADNASVVISVATTGEAQQNRMLQKVKESGGALDDIDWTPREVLDRLIVQVFPIHAYEKVLKNGKEVVQPVLDKDGKHAIDKEALAMREQLRDSLSDMALPGNPIDLLIEHFEKKGIGVAELTGRKERIGIDAKTGKKALQKRKAEGVAQGKTNLAEVKKFQDGEKRIAIISDAASTGISLHASNRAKNKQRRVHIALELKWSADKQLQDFGRTHRSDQASAPEYVLLSVDIGGDKRFSATIARRLGSLGALTKGSREASGAGEIAKYNFETEYGRTAQTAVLAELMRTEEGRETLADMGLLKRDPKSKRPVGNLNPGDVGNVPRFLNRVLTLPVAAQNALFEKFVQHFGSAIEAAKRNGTFDEGVSDLKGAIAVRLTKNEEIPNNQADGAKTFHYAFEVDEHTHPADFARALEWKRNREEIVTAQAGPAPGFYQQAKSGNVAMVTPGGTVTDPKSGRAWRRVAILRPSGNTDYMAEEEFLQKYSPVSDTLARTWWNEAYKRIPKTRTRELHLIGGAVLGVWRQIQATGAAGLEVVRVPLDNGGRMVGLEIPNAHLADVLKALGVGRELVDPKAIFAGVVDQGEEVLIAGGMKLRRTMVHREPAFEIAEAPSTVFSQIRALPGVIEERIDGKLRFFIPTDPTLGQPVLDALLEKFPVIRQTTGGAHSARAGAEPRPRPAPLRTLAEAREIEAIETRAADAAAAGKPGLFKILRARLAKLMKDELGEHDVARSIEAVQETHDEFRKVFNPIARGDSAKRAAFSLRNKSAVAAREYLQAEHALEKARTYFSLKSWETSLDFINRIEADERQPTEQLQQWADVIREQLDRQRDAVQALGTGKLQSFYDTYFPHIWKRPAQAAEAFKRIFAKRPIEGPKSFLKKRKYQSFQEGVDAGLQPVSENAVDLVLLKLKEMDRYLLAHRFLHEMKRVGMVRYVPILKRRRAPAGWVELPDPIGTVWGPPFINVKEAQDADMWNGLQRVAEHLGVPHRRVPTMRGGRWGFSVKGADKVVTRYAGPESVLIHEIGHVLDNRYGLANQLVKSKLYAQELRDLADLRILPGDSETQEKYYRRGSEKIANMVAAYVHARARFQKTAPATFAWFDRFVKMHPELQELVGLEYGMGLQTRKQQYPVGGLILRGHYYMPEAAAHVVKNFLAPGLAGKAWYRGARGLSNSMLQFALGFSGYHAGFTTYEAMVSRLAIGVEEALTGHPLRAAGQVARIPITPFTNVILGGRVLAAYFDDAIDEPQLSQYVKAILLAGGRVKMDELYRTRMRQQFADAWRRADVAGKLGQILGPQHLPRNIGAIAEAAAWPVMEWLVPRQKVGAFCNIARNILERHPDATREELRAKFAAAWDSIDNRFGQMVYDNLFFDRVAKDLLMISVQSLGWNLGTFRELGGGVIDYGRAGVQGAKYIANRIGGGRGGAGGSGGGSGGGPGDGMGENGSSGEPGRVVPPPEVTHRMAYVLALPILTAFIGAITTYLNTKGTRRPDGTEDDGLPASYKDYFFPRTGNWDEQGHAERLNMVGYMKDVFHWFHDPVNAAKNKLNPLVRWFAETVTNKDYFNVKIADPNDPLWKIGADELAHTAKFFMPYSFRNLQQERERGGGLGMQLAPQVGITAAPAYITRTPAQNRMGELARAGQDEGGMSHEAFDRLSARRALINAMKRRDGTAVALAQRAMQDGKLTPRDIGRVIGASGKDRDTEAYKRLQVAGALDVYRVANEQERRQFAPILVQKLLRAIQSKPAEEMRILRDRYQDVFTALLTKKAA